MKLSEFEAQVMAVIWELGECSAPQVHQAITQQRQVTYSTVKTIIDRLERKQAISRTRADGRTIFFQATTQPAKVQGGIVDRLLNTVFAGDRRPLLAQLLDSDKLSRDDLEYLAELVEAKKREQRDD